MLNNKKAEHLLQQISAAYNDSEVAEDTKLREELLTCAQELDKTGNYLSVATKVNGLTTRAFKTTTKGNQYAISADCFDL